MAGIEASTITSEGTCRLVMPRSESTIARAGPAANPACTAAAIAAPSGSEAEASNRAPSPSLALSPAAVSTSPYSAKTSGRNDSTTCPKMIGSETFIIVAFRCTENSTSSACARAIWAVRNLRRAATRSTVASTTSPASTGTAGLSTVTLPSAATCSTRRVSAASITTDCSPARKSSAPIVATLVFDSGDQAPMECGCWRAKFFTEAGARRSELPSRSTGLTALPLTLS